MWNEVISDHSLVKDAELKKIVVTLVCVVTIMFSILMMNNVVGGSMASIMAQYFHNCSAYQSEETF